jgi:O-antigen/teichoic acid export membrane protein
LAYLGIGLVLASLMPFIITPIFGSQFSRAVKPAIILTIAGSFLALGNILNQGLRGIGRPYPGLASQLLGIGVLVVAALILTPTLGIMGMSWAVVLGTCVQLLAMVVTGAIILRLSPVCFWGFHIKEIKGFYKQLNSILPRFVNIR